MRRIDIEKELHEGRVWLLAKFEALSHDQRHEPLTPSEHTRPISGARSTTWPTSR